MDLRASPARRRMNARGDVRADQDAVEGGRTVDGGRPAGGRPVLVAGSLSAFLRQESVPQDIDVTLFDEAEPLPAGEWLGVMPTVAERVDAAAIRRLPRLRVIANYGVGYDNIDVGAAHAAGVAVTNTPGVLTGATAELTWALILAAARRVPEGERLVRSGGWSGWTPTQLLGSSLDGGVLGIVGAGRIGREVARRAKPFGMDVLYAGRRTLPEFEAETGARRVSLDELLGSADVVSVHVALAPDTRHLIDAAALACMKPDAILINTARGAVIDQAALADALRERRIRAAGVDVYEDEPLVPEALRALDNVVLLPHLGSATEQARGGMWRKAWTNLVLGARGEPVRDPVGGAPPVRNVPGSD